MEKPFTKIDHSHCKSGEISLPRFPVQTTRFQATAWNACGQGPSAVTKRMQMENKNPVSNGAQFVKSRTMEVSIGPFASGTRSEKPSKLPIFRRGSGDNYLKDSATPDEEFRSWLKRTKRTFSKLANNSGILLLVQLLNSSDPVAGLFYPIGTNSSSACGSDRPTVSWKDSESELHRILW